MRKLLAIWALLGVTVWGLTLLGGCASHTELGGRRMGVTANFAPPQGEPVP
jgi:hypothetical protein